MYKLKKWFAWLFVALSLFALAACQPTDDNGDGGDGLPPPILNEYELQLSIGETFTLEVLGAAETAAIEWASLDVSVATVENGEVTAVAVGETRVEATADGYSMVCFVSVSLKPQAAARLKIVNQPTAENGYEAVRLFAGDTFTFVPVLTVGNTQVTEATFSLETASEAISVNGCTVTAIAPTAGATVTVVCEYGGARYTVDCVVIVE